MAKATIILSLLLSCFITHAQNKYRVYFTDKQTTFNPNTYFDAKAIERRQHNGLSLADSTDFPVNPNYINAVTVLADSTRPESRWFNCMSVFTDEVRINQIKALPFVKQVEQLDIVPNHAFTSIDFDTTISKNQMELLVRQVNMMEGDSFIVKGIDGKGIRIAILDAGFPTVDTSPVFEHIRKDNRIIATYDFARKKEDVYAYNIHGAMVMACIGGKINGKNVGLATGSSFLLARTETPGYEMYSEEEYWLAAVEWADKNGADIINSSLGYTNELYFRSQMDGRQTIIAKAATMAVKKGILVVNAAGNEGTDDWRIVASPGDADSVLTVGGINPETGYHSEFSSFGPNRKFNLKPNVCGAGTALTVTRTGMGVSYGTSFASPLVAGFAACAWQTDSTLTNVDLFKRIEQSGNLYPYYDYAHGYGIPQAMAFLNDTAKAPKSFDVTIADGELTMVILPEFFTPKPEFAPPSSRGPRSGFSNLNYVPQKEGWDDRDSYVYYHVARPDSVLLKYYVELAYSTSPVKVSQVSIPEGGYLRIYYKGYTFEYQRPVK